MEFSVEAVEVTGLWDGLIRCLGFILGTRDFFKTREQHDQIFSWKGSSAVLRRMVWQRRAVGRPLKSSLK